MLIRAKEFKGNWNQVSLSLDRNNQSTFVVKELWILKVSADSISLSFKKVLRIFSI